MRHAWDGSSVFCSVLCEAFRIRPRRWKRQGDAVPPQVWLSRRQFAQRRHQRACRSARALSFCSPNGDYSARTTPAVLYYLTHQQSNSRECYRARFQCTTAETMRLSATHHPCVCVYERGRDCYGSSRLDFVAGSCSIAPQPR